jgi:hypothetical protein
MIGCFLAEFLRFVGGGARGRIGFWRREWDTPRGDHNILISLIFELLGGQMLVKTLVKDAPSFSASDAIERLTSSVRLHTF